MPSGRPVRNSIWPSISWHVQIVVPDGEAGRFAAKIRRYWNHACPDDERTTQEQ